MKPIYIICVLMAGLIVMACGGGTTSDSDFGLSDLDSQEQAELVAAAISGDQGSLGEDIAIIAQAANGQPQQQLQAPEATISYSISLNIDYYDVLDQLQDGYDALTTDRIDYDSHIQGEIIDGPGYFVELSIDNHANFTMDEILSRTVWINGTHTNLSSYRHVNPITQASIDVALDGELIVTDLTVDLDAGDTFPESGTIEGTLTGSYERVGPFGRYSRSFNIHFIATYLGDNTAEIEFDDGTVYIVRLEDGSVERSE